ncbi:hypothetical protein HK096_001367, partial [Nowakowskiella sp. JEL0078]
MGKERKIYSDNLRLKQYESYLDLFYELYNAQLSNEGEPNSNNEITNYIQNKFIKKKKYPRSEKFQRENIECKFCGRNGHIAKDC